MKVFGFTGSRRRNANFDKKLVYNVVDHLPVDALVISGKCPVENSTDNWAVKRAKSRGIETKEFPPKEDVSYEEFTKSAHDRNQEIVDCLAENDGVLFAVMVDDTGGTWDTIKRALESNVLVLANIRVQNNGGITIKHDDFKFLAPKMLEIPYFQWQDHIF
jgi:hypothetical protein